MKRYFIRCMGAILSAMSFGTQADAGSVDSHNYTITVAPNYTRRWYVGWASNNKGETHSESFTKGENIFNQPRLTEDDIDADAYGYSVDDYGWVYVRQPGITHSGDVAGVTGSGMVITSDASFYLLNPSGDGIMYTGLRVGVEGQNTGVYMQYILVGRNHVGAGGVGNLIYAPTASYFHHAGCCVLDNICEYSGQSSCTGFSYSGQGEDPITCPCYFTYADVSYSGSTDCYASTIGGGPYPSSGLTQTTDLNISKGCPARIQDVTVCYNHLTCGNSKYTDKAAIGQGISGCDMILNPLVGMANSKHVSTGVSDDWDLGRVTCAKDDMQWYCTPSFMSGMYNGNYMNYMTTTDYGDINWCTACPVPTKTTMNTFPLTNTSYGSNGGIGIASCYVKGPTAADNSGTFEFTTSAGATQTCYGNHYAT